jgi:hypothetical protein
VPKAKSNENSAIEAEFSIRKGRGTDRGRERDKAKMIIALHNFANAPKIEETLLDVSKNAGL